MISANIGGLFADGAFECTGFPRRESIELLFMNKVSPELRSKGIIVLSIFEFKTEEDYKSYNLKLNT